MSWDIRILYGEFMIVIVQTPECPIGTSFLWRVALTYLKLKDTPSLKFDAIKKRFSLPPCAAGIVISG